VLKKLVFSEVVLIGSTSDIGIALIEKLHFTEMPNIHLVGRNLPDKSKFLGMNANLKFYECDLSDANSVNRFVSDLTIFKRVDLVVLAVGVLPKENAEFDLTALEKTLQVNTVSSILFLSSFANKMNNESGGRIIVCSSVASMRPRLRNFSYGASKSALDFYAVGLQNKLKMSKVSIYILRPGFIFTKMTKKFDPAPFAISLDRLAYIAAKGIQKGNKVIYAPSQLRLLMNLVRFVPRRVFDRLG
jgi:decaprenylphospho-beta-D-erythro-pentofuranosid-2-ulose 2-reductase